MKTSLLVLTFLIAGCDRSAEYYETSAKHWLDSMKLGYQGVSCSAHDSDGDGYVTCAVNVEAGKPMQTILCDGRGCKPGKDFLLSPTTPPAPAPPPAPSASASKEMR